MISRMLDTTIGTKFLAIDNADLLAAFSNAASLAGADLGTRQAHRSGEGKLILTADLNALTDNIPELGGVITPRLWLKNDNTGGSALTVGIGFFRLVCLNGLYMGLHTAMGLKLSHRDGPTAHNVLDLLPETLNSVVANIASGEATEALIEASQQKVLNPIDIIGSLNIGKKAKERSIDLVAWNHGRQEDDYNSVFGLYNLVNEQIAKTSRSSYRAAEKDMGLMQNIQLLSEAQYKLAV